MKTPKHNCCHYKNEELCRIYNTNKYNNNIDITSYNIFFNKQYRISYTNLCFSAKYYFNVKYFNTNINKKICI